MPRPWAITFNPAVLFNRRPRAYALHLDEGLADEAVLCLLRVSHVPLKLLLRVDVLMAMAVTLVGEAEQRVEVHIRHHLRGLVRVGRQPAQHVARELGHRNGVRGAQLQPKIVKL